MGGHSHLLFVFYTDRVAVGESLRCLGAAPGPSTCSTFSFAEQIFVFLVLISMALTLGFRDMVTEFKAKHHYVAEKHVHSVTTESFLIFCSFLILLSVMVPMSAFFT